MTKYKYKDEIKQLIFDKYRMAKGSLANEAFNQRDELNEVYKDAATLDRMHEIFNDARKPMHIAEEEIYEILRGEQE